jgi:nucleoside-diphosphate-sugar epimerase
MLCALHADAHLQPTIARCFAFVGPYLPLDAHFAVGNFIRDGLQGGPIRISGDGTPYRSYLYAADLAIWLWTILLRGQSMRPYNVGSAQALTVEELAHVVADAFAPAVPIDVPRAATAGVSAQQYVPAVTRAETELGLRLTVPLAEAIHRTVGWHRAVGTTSHRASSPA